MDLVQDALFKTFQRLDRFEDRGKGAFQAYLRQAVMNRIADEIRVVVRRPNTDVDGNLDHLVAHGMSPFDMAVDAQWEHRYKAALRSLTTDQRMLVVGRLELDYSYDQLALVTGRATAGAARIAVRRAVTALADLMAAS